MVGHAILLAIRYEMQPGVQGWENNAAERVEPTAKSKNIPLLTSHYSLIAIDSNDIWVI
jgi:hypothetical protein